jgi:hypothetical protein
MFDCNWNKKKYFKKFFPPGRKWFWLPKLIYCLLRSWKKFSPVSAIEAGQVGKLNVFSCNGFLCALNLQSLCKIIFWTNVAFKKHNANLDILPDSVVVHYYSYSGYNQIKMWTKIIVIRNIFFWIILLTFLTVPYVFSISI